ncbi:MAG: hypothetical protein IPO75_11400 [Betaproteobacteria bacterium]|nr:hypothetical protein [Betaproteobacteria bacterium]
MPPTLSARGVRQMRGRSCRRRHRLTQDYGERAATTRAIRDQHSHGEGLADAALPDVVVFPAEQRRGRGDRAPLPRGTRAR